MKPSTIAALVIAAGVAVTAGYYLGRQQAAAPQQAAKGERKVLYYRNPMGLPDTSPVPKKDAMGMDYVPVYEGEEPAGASVAVSPERVQLLGVKTERVQLRKLTRIVRAAATVQPAERSLHLIAPRFAGWVQELHVSATGQRVSKGQALLTVYSPDLESAVREYQLALQSGLNDVAESTRQRLANWQISDDDLAHLKHGMANLVLRSPINGVVLEKPATAGARFAAGDMLFKLADLSSVWVEAEVPEQDQALLHLDEPATVNVDAYPGEEFQGKVSFISPVLNADTRTARVRVELANRDGRLRPAMFAHVEIAAQPLAQPVPSVSQSAVIDTGTRQLAIVQVAPGRFAPREVKLGSRAGDYVEVLEGLSEGEEVVTRANFLLDAESNLKAALGAAPHQHGTTSPPELPEHRHQPAPSIEQVHPKAHQQKTEPTPAATEHHHAE
jgi:Cu(I)/Ag(I) efflux system membrane fusion protein